MSQDQVLDYLKANYPNWFRPSDMADILQTNRETISNNCRVLFKNWGLINRKKNPDDQQYFYQFKRGAR